MPLIGRSAFPSILQTPSAFVDHGHANQVGEAEDPLEINLGFVNLMPQAPFQSVERRFLRLLDLASAGTTINAVILSLGQDLAQFVSAAPSWQDYSHLDTPRSKLDALIITGAVPTAADIEDEPFWPELRRLLDWAADNVLSTFCSCLAAHAAVAYFYGVKRRRLDRKRWGVFSHEVRHRHAPLVRDLEDQIPVPHSRFFEVTAADISAAGLALLVTSPEAGPHLFTSPDGARFVFSQGHPEYGRRTLLRELLRDSAVGRAGATEFQYPARYFPPEVEDWFRAPGEVRPDGTMTDTLQKRLEAVGQRLDCPWEPAAVSVMSAWLQMIRQAKSVIATTRIGAACALPGVLPTEAAPQNAELRAGI